MMRELRAPVGLTLLLVALVAGGCERPSGPVSVKRSREVMGTLAAVTAVAGDKATAAAATEAAYTRLADVNRLMSDYVADSEIGRLNAGGTRSAVAVSPETFHCIQKAIEIAEASGGAFDITCRPLVNLWKRAAKRKQLPTEQELSTAQNQVGWQKVDLEPHTRTVTLLVDGLQVDLGGIAKGYGLDLAAEAMKVAGAGGGLIDVGGDIVAFGTRPNGEFWRIGVRHPFADGLIDELELCDAAVATSGVQQRFFEIEGRRYSHIIDPRSGWPAEQAPSVTVIADDGLTADAWATVFSVLSVAEGQALLSGPDGPDVEVMWITGSREAPVIEQTPGFGRSRSARALPPP